MPDIDLHKAYDSMGESIHDLFDSAEEGFFVPLYQREYTWEEDNINQLFEDLLQGVRDLSVGNDDATTFLGTTILTNLTDKKPTVVTGEDKAQPTAVRIVIDGQQRISTIALISIQLIVRLTQLANSLPNKDPYEVLHHHCKDLVETLRKLHTIKLGRGANPPNKPKIIRAHEDQWTYDGEDTNYQSPIAHYIAAFIRTNDPKKSFDAVDATLGARVRGNIGLINEWLDGICNAHIPQTKLFEQFPCGNHVVTARMQGYVLGFEDAKVKAAIAKLETKTDQNDYFAAAIYHVFLLTHYLLRRCGVNRLQPTKEDWGFDMFQALNATGTPLTAMETFLPQVMQAEQAAGQGWVKTPSRQYMDEIGELFEVTTTNEQKAQRTNELLGTFALCYEGEKLGNKFSAQRRWITGVYEKRLKTIDEKRDFLGQLSRVSNFYFDAWYMAEPKVPFQIVGLDAHPQGEFTSLLVQYLRDASSKLSAPILARFYSQALDGTGTFDEFVEAVKACAAFFTLWRSSNSTSGLDDSYRKFFSGSSSSVKVAPNNWIKNPNPLKSSDLKSYFSDVLEDGKVRKKDLWISASERFLIYSELKTICRFVLFVAAHNRAPDPATPGLTVAGTQAVCPLLVLSRWNAKDHKSLEHVAPQNPPQGHNWDATIYTENLVHQIGNLLLLPVDINKFVDNKEWAVKYLHYGHVGARTKQEIEKLSATAKASGVTLSKKAITVLEQTKYSCAVEPVLQLGATGNWDAALIKNRTKQMKEVTWDVLDQWLTP
ncbi:MAG: DUF262 domain-containing HNH endonuclease family protein [Hyphomicrobiales bacterium]|nr:DUF262 domain-containing HNH endonuclease family protein [Hyphomicrobiales bacterium]